MARGDVAESFALRPRRRPLLARALPRPLAGSPLALLSLGIVVLWGAAAVAAPLLAPYPPLDQDIVRRLAPPNTAHWLGTDPLGRDILSRIVYGARLSIPVGVAAVGLAVILGMMIGSTAGTLGGAVDEVMMRITDLMLAFPT
ncbi:MAG: D,D-dipeptide ABC transporter permease, partial [Bacillati bacterium ANGP1]